MKNLIFNGSPRLDGCSVYICNELEKALPGTLLIPSYQRRVEPCVHCDACVESAECPIRDPMQEIYTKIKQADNLIFILPVYFMGIPAPLKAMIDRTQVFWNHPIEEEKNGAVIMVAENSNHSMEPFYKKNWTYILRNLGVKEPLFHLWGNLKSAEDIDSDSLKSFISSLRDWQ